MAGPLVALCVICGGNDLHEGGDGFFYCTVCGSQSQQYQEQALDYMDPQQFAGYQRRSYHKAEAPAAAGAAAGVLDPSVSLHAGEPEPAAFFDSQFGYTEDLKPWETGRLSQQHDLAQTNSVNPIDTVDDDGAAIRKLYIEGLQDILQMQCETAVQELGVSPLICGLVAPVWLRFLAHTSVFEKEWAKEALQVEEARQDERRKKKQRKKEELEDNTEAQEKGPKDEELEMRMALQFIWLRALKERVPLSITLALLYLGCHIAREPILPTDVVNWALRGNLPYLAAFCKIESKRVGLSWPIEARLMFKPTSVLGARKLEFMAASIARRTGLQLPPVNSHAIAHRFLKQLKLPVEKLSVYVCRMFDWYTPSGFWLSDEVHALPSRIYVMAMLVIVLKVLYRIDGQWHCPRRTATFGTDGQRSKCKTWRLGRCKSHGANKKSQSMRLNGGESPKGDMASQGVDDSSLDTLDMVPSKDETWNLELLLDDLERGWQDNKDVQIDTDKELGPYLKYCKDVVFSGLKLEGDEENICEKMWRLFERPQEKETFVVKDEPKAPQRLDAPAFSSLSGGSHFSMAQKDPTLGPNSEVSSFPKSSRSAEAEENVSMEVEDADKGSAYGKSRSLEEIVQDMEELGFMYLPPRRFPVPPGKYLRYVRKKSQGKKVQRVLHADYFILLCACAKVIAVEPVALYWGVQRVENCLKRIEGKVKAIVQAEAEKLM